MAESKMTRSEVAAEVVRAVRRKGNARSDRREQTARRIRVLAAKGAAGT